MLPSIFSVFCAVLLVLNFAAADRILVLLDSETIRNTHSTFLDLLKNKHEVTVALADSPNLSLIEFGESVFEHLIILAPSVQG